MATTQTKKQAVATSGRYTSKSRDEAIAKFKNASKPERMQLLEQAGIVDSSGQLTKRFKQPAKTKK